MIKNILLDVDPTLDSVASLSQKRLSLFNLTLIQILRSEGGTPKLHPGGY